MTPLELMQRARAQLLIQDRFYGTLCMHLELIEDKTCPTAWTDGNVIGFNPDFILTLSDTDRIFLFKHEVWHPILDHHLRRGDRNPIIWNIAGDRVIHQHFRHQENMELIKGAQYDPSDKGLNTEMVYEKVYKEVQQQGQNGQGKGNGPGISIGEVRDLKGSGSDDKPTSSEKAMAEGKWVEALERAVKEAEQGRGNIPNFARELLEAKKKPKINWKEVLRRFVQENMDNSDYSWMKPNKKYMASDMYLPSLAISKDEIDNIIMAVDTSGSMRKDQLDQVVDELSLILEEYKTKVTVFLIDTQVHKVLEFTNDDLPIKIEAIGRGGTDFRPAFEKIKELELEPTCFLYYTDGDGYFPSVEPEYPVLWVGTQNFKPPFGEYVACI